MKQFSSVLVLILIKVVAAETIYLESYDQPGHYIRHSGNVGVINPISTAEEAAFSAFNIVSGLANSSCLSFESVNQPGYYLRHSGLRLWLHIFSDTNLYKQDATFCEKPGLADPAGVSYESLNYANYHIRHNVNNELFLAVGSTATIYNNATFYKQSLPNYTPPVRVAWLKADDNILVGDDARVIQWHNQAAGPFDYVQAIVASEQPYFYSQTPEKLINFNPSLEFRGSQLLRYYYGHGDYAGDLHSNESGFSIYAIIQDEDTNLLRLRAPAGFGDNGNDPAFDILTLADSPSGLRFWMDGSAPAVVYYSNLSLYNGNPGGNNIQPQIFGVTSSNSSVHVRNNLKVLVDGAQENTDVDIYQEWGIGKGLYVGASGCCERWKGKVAEIIWYSPKLDLQQEKEVLSYLAMKYGITLLQTPSNDYWFTSTALKSWDATLGSGFGEDIAVIAKDSTSSLDQRVSRSVNHDGIITLSTTDDFLSPNTSLSRISLNHNEFVSISNNNGSNQWVATDAPAGYKVFNRRWQFQTNRTENTIFLQVQVDDPNFNVIAPETGSLYYWVQDLDLDGSLEDETPILMDSRGNGQWVIEVQPKQGQVFSLTTSSSINSIHLNTSTNAGTCTPHEVVVNICRDILCSSLATDFVGEIGLSTSTNRGSWQVADADGTLSDPVQGDGQAEYSFVSSDQGSISLLLENPFADDLIISASSSTALNDDSDIIIFSSNQIDIQPKYLEEQSSFVAGMNHEINLKYLAQDGGVCTTVPCTSTHNLTFEVQHDTFMGPPLPSALQLNSVPLNLLPISIPVSFVNGIASVNLTTTDVGRFILKAEDASGSCINDANGNPKVIAGSSSNLIIRPFGLREGTKPDSVQIADKPYFAFIEGVIWSPEDDLDLNGVADSGADLTNNLKAASFGLEWFPQIPTPQIQYTWPDSLGAAQGNLSSLSTERSSGQIRYEFTYSEVGEIQLRFDLENYLLSSDDLTYTTKEKWLRFTPNHLQFSVVNVPELAAYCGGVDYHYSGALIDLDTMASIAITAYSHTNKKLLNYKENYFRWSDQSLSHIINHVSASDASTLIVAPLISTRFEDPTSSSEQYTMDTIFTIAPAFQYTKPVLPHDPFIPNINFGFSESFLTDSDGVCFQETSISSCRSLSMNVDSGLVNRLIYGKILVKNTHGPADMHLPMPIESQYWNGSEYEKIKEDSCLTFSNSGLNLVDATYFGALQQGETSIINGTALFNSGEETITLSAPGNDNSGAVVPFIDLDAVSLSYLKIDEDQDGTMDNPSGRATFGVFRGHDNIIWWEEVK